MVRCLRGELATLDSEADWGAGAWTGVILLAAVLVGALLWAGDVLWELCHPAVGYVNVPHNPGPSRCVDLFHSCNSLGDTIRGAILRPRGLIFPSLWI